MFIGIDGGWSKTAGVLVDGAGVVHARARVEGAVIAATPSAACLATLARLIDELLQGAGAQRGTADRVAAEGTGDLLPGLG